MDLSKLPRLSGDQKPADPQASAPLPAQTPGDPVPPRETLAYGRNVDRALRSGPEIWLSFAVGAILMFIGWEFAQWLFATLAGQVYDTGVNWTKGPMAGQRAAYWQIVGHQALSDSAMFLFGFAMVMEAVATLIASLLPRFFRPVIMGALLITIAMTLYNLIAVIVLMRDGITPLISMLAVAFGGYIAFGQGSMLKSSADVPDARLG